MAYDCANCPLAAHDPGPGARASFEAWLYLNEFPAGHFLRDHRWRLLTEERSAAEIDELMEGMAEIETEVARMREAYQRAAERAQGRVS